MADSRWLDTEIDAIFEGDPELTALAHTVRAARPEPTLDPRFKGVLRAQLMREAAQARRPAGRAARPQATSQRRWWSRPAPFAFGGLGIALAAVAVLAVLRTPIVDHQVTAGSPVAELHAVSPNNVITVAFSQPMNEAAVVAGLHIRPATEVATSWHGNNLLITPKHHLAGNTPYTVTIDHNATLALNGSLAAADIRISFGTAPTPPVAPSIAQLAPLALSSVSDASQLISAGNGTVIATSSTAAIGGTGPSSTSPPSESPSSSQGAGVAPAPSGRLVAMSAQGRVVDLGPAASSAALAPSGLRLVAAVPGASTTKIELISIDGSGRNVLARLSTQVLATGWLSADTALVAEPDRIVTVDLLGRVSTLTTLPAGTSSVIFAPAGGQAFAGSPGQDGQLIDLASRQARSLPGSRQIAAFSGDGSMVGWVDATGPSAQLMTSPVSREAAAAVPLNEPGASISAIALDRQGTHMVIADQPLNGAAELDVVALPSGGVIARGPAARAPVYLSAADQIAFVSGGVVQIATVPGIATGTAVNVLPDGAAGALKAFVDAQVAGDSTALGSLGIPGLQAAGTTPGGLSRAYVISAATNPDGTIAATARLIVDPSGDRATATFADETLLLSPNPNGSGYLVSSLTIGSLQQEPVGPHVVSVVPTAAAGNLVLRVSFDSDLRPGTVAAAITVTTRGGQPLSSTTVYDPNTRTATVTLSEPAETVVALHIATTLIDVNGQALAGEFTTTSAG